jgi:glycosyltransferase involved in cell wall biosynthesis
MRPERRRPTTGLAAAEEPRQARRLRLLFAVPFPPRRDSRHGGRVIAQLMLHLADRHEVGIAYLRREGSPPLEPELEARCALVEEVAASRHVVPEAWRHRLHVLAAPLTGVPSPVAVSAEPAFAPALESLVESWSPDVVQLEHEASAFHLWRLGRTSAPVVLVCHEPGGAAARDLARVTSGRQRVAHRLDGQTWERYFRRAVRHVDSIVVFTERDRQALEPHARETPLVTIPLGIDLPERPLSPAGRGDPSVVFVGGYLHPPNVDAALRLLRSIAPAARERVPRLRALAVGADPTEELRAAAGPQDLVTGRVPDVTPYVDEAALVVLPIHLGGGMRVKLLEALAAGKAVVASPLAAAGLEVTDGRQLVLAESDEEFTEAVVRLLEDEERRVELARSAREWALRNLSWESRVEAYERLYESLLRERG